MKRILLLFLVFLQLNCTSKSLIYTTSFDIILQGVDTEKISELSSDLVIIDYSFDGSADKELTKEDVNIIRRSGKKVFAYLSVGEAEDYRFYWKDEYYYNPPEWIYKENPNWPGNYMVRYWHSEWQNIVFEYLKRIMDKDFDGVFLDTVDTYVEFADKDSNYDYSRLMINFLNKIILLSCDVRCTDFYIVLNNSEDLVFKDKFLFDNVSGFIAESVYTDGSDNYQSDKDITRRESNLIQLQRKKKCIMLIEYLKDPVKQNAISNIAIGNGFLIRFLDPSLSA